MWYPATFTAISHRPTGHSVSVSLERGACSMLEIIQHLEVIIRNLVHAQLRASEVGRTPWYLDPEFALSSRTFAELQSAVRRASGPRAEQGKAVAEINFGTWRFLMSKRYRNLVWARVAPAMQGVPRRERDLTEFNNSLSYLNRIRNRCAHNEPVYDIDPHEFVRHIGYLARHIGPEAEE